MWRGQRPGAMKTAGVGAQGLVGRPRVARRPGARRARKALALASADGGERVIQAAAGLDLDEGDRAAALHDEVDLAAGLRIASREGAVALEEEQRERDPLGPLATEIGRAPTRGHRPHGLSLASASARA